MTSAFPSVFLTLNITPEQRLGHYTLVWGMGSHSIRCYPETDVMLGNLLRRLQPVLVGGQDLSRQLLPNDLLHTVGVYLWQILLPDSVLPGEREALECELRRGTTPLILELPSNLAALPWELLCDPQQPGETGFLARRRPMVRLMPGVTNLSPLAPPLRILLLISSPPGLVERQRIDIESERAAVENATRDVREAGMLHLLVEDIVTPRRVQQAFLRFKPHILHYVGHGGYDEDTEGYLLWEDDRGEPMQMSDARLADLLRPRGLRAVLLHGCQTASSHASTDFHSVAGTLLNAGIPAVLAQQAGFTYESSQRASEMFYTALINGAGLAEATFEMRLALVQANRPDWAVPTLQATTGGLLPLIDKEVPAGMSDPAVVRRGATADLPAPRGVFVGRQHELRRLRAMLENAPGSGPVLALITGPGGVGKSTLAAQAIARYGGQYKGTLTLSCAGYQSIDLFLQRIAEFLQRQGNLSLLERVMPDPKLSIAAKIEAAITAFDQEGPCLLVVDNLESTQQTDHTLIDPHLLLFLHKLLLNLRGGRVIITGRYIVKNLLPDGKFAASVLHLDLDDLSRYEIHQLLTRHHLLEQLSDTVRDELVREFGGLPYVYDVLSSKAARQNLTNLIHDAQGRITREQRQRAATEWEQVRQQIIENAALEVVIQQLSEEARLLLAKLSLFCRPFPQQALEQGLCVTSVDWQPLVEWALLRWNPVEKNYRLHSLTAQYVATLLDTQERCTVQVQIAEWYLNFAVDTSHDLADYLEAHSLFRAAGERERAAEVAINLMPSLQKSGLNQIQHDLCVATIQDFSNQQSRHTAEALRQLGILAQQQGEYDKAKQFYHEAISLFTQMNDEHGRAITLGELGTNAQEQGKYSEAQRFYHQAFALLQKLGDERGQATVLCHLGMMSQRQGEYGEAQRFYHEALALSQHVGDEGGCAASFYQLGVVAQRQGAYEEAQRFFESTLTIAEKTNDRAGKADFLLQMGMLAQEQKEYAKARRLLDQALTLFEQQANQRGRATALHNLGMLAQRQKEFATARHFYHEALAIFERWGDQRARVSVLAQLGSMLQNEGKCEEARGLYDEALKIFEELNDQDGRATTLGQLGLLALQQADYATSLRFAAQAATIHGRLHSPQRDTALQTLLRIQTEIGDTAFSILWQQAFRDQPLPDLSSVDRQPYPLKVLMAFIQAQTPVAARRIIETHPTLLSAEAERLLEEMATMAAQRDDEVDKMIEPKHALLSRCRRIGIAAAFAELHQGQGK